MPLLAVANDYSGVLCDAHFGAACAWVARSGVGLIYPGGTTLPDLWPLALGSYPKGPVWNASSWAPDAVYINIGGACRGGKEAATMAGGCV